MLSTREAQEILRRFSVEDEICELHAVKNGLINKTFAVTLSNGEKYLLQDINVAVFKNPDELMTNITGVTGFLREKISACGGNPKTETLCFLPTADGKYYYRDENNSHWRVCIYIDNTFTYSCVDDPDIMYRAGSCFGKFQAMLAEYPIDTLYDTIPDFHNTAKRFAALKKAVEENRSGRAESCREDIDFALSYEEDAGRLVKLTENGKLPVRVTHNDTKINNVLFDCDTKETVCVIDLDTVMPGLSLYDFGDAMRSGAANIIEDSPEYDKAGIRTDLYEAYVKGYLSSVSAALTENEIKMLPFSAKLLTYECGIRFLTDYLDGDVYFGTDYPEHNIVRARNQFAMVRDIERKMPELEKITENAYKEAIGK
ncbi:MAG: aminoglycoside phosphotransferase family protein [Clostridia bacterium]|nr:aminoglycoside phosphotransferase family protein [Clostridia bacterium]